MSIFAIIGALVAMLAAPFVLCLGFVAALELAIRIVAPYRDGEVPPKWNDE